MRGNVGMNSSGERILRRKKVRKREKFEVTVVFSTHRLGHQTAAFRILQKGAASQIQ